MYLPDDIVPVRYDLSLTTYLSPNTSVTVEGGNRVVGQVAIRVRLGRATNCLVLHTNGALNITSVAWRPVGGSAQGEADVKGQVEVINPDVQQAILSFASALPQSPSAAPGAPPQAMSKAGAPDEAQLGQLLISFSYPLLPGVDGFYLSTYGQPKDSLQYNLASTQFESTAARKAFPCFDEPRFKARFALTLATTPSYTVLSNMPLEFSSAPRADGLVERRFAVSPPMSTYLMAWVVGSLASVNTNCATDYQQGTAPPATVPITVYSTPSKSGMLNHALSAACSAVQRYVTTLGVPYTLPKLDLVGIPDFVAGAMENWGLITYQEADLLVDPAQDDVAQMMNVGSTVAHEIAHQWFGNLVTCSDWTELWLNEGFATYFQNIGADAWRPEYGFLQSFFFTDATVPALVQDSLGATHPLSSSRRVEALQEIDNYFDGISYQKAGAVLRMLRMYTSVVVTGGAAFTTQGVKGGNTVPTVGTVTALPFASNNISFLPLRRLQGAAAGAQERAGGRKMLQNETPLTMSTYLRPTWRDEPLFAGLKAYLEQKQYGAVTAKDLWDSLTASTGLPISSWMKTWTYDRNYPVLHVDQVDVVTQADPNNLGSTLSTAVIKVHQAPILASRQCGVVAGGDTPDQTGQWWLPIMAALQDPDVPNQVSVVTMTECTATFSLNLGANPDTAFLLNVGRYGFFRVNYTDDMWDRVTDAASNPTVVSSMDMAGLLSDTYRLSEVGQLDLMPFLSMITNLGMRSTAELAPWRVALSKLHRMRMSLMNAALEATPDGEQIGNCRDDMDQFLNAMVTQPLISNLPLTFDVSADDPIQLRLLRPTVLNVAGVSGSVDTLSMARALMKPIQTAALGGQAVDLSPLHPDVRDVVYCLNLRASDVVSARAEAYNATKKLYLQESSPLEKSRLLYSLTCAKDAALYQDLLDFLGTPAVRIQDVGGVLETLGHQGGAAFQAVWNYFFSSFDKLVGRWPSQSSATYSLGLSVKALAAYFTNTNRQGEMEIFVERYGAMLDPNFLTYYTEHTTNNAQWIGRTAPDLCTYLSELFA